MARFAWWLVIASCTCLGGCAALSPHFTPSNKNSEAPKKLLAWQVGKKKDDAKNGEEKADEPEEPDTIATDRPDFTEASTAVGKGRIQLESGYTYFRDANAGERTVTHSYPEVLVRIGMFAEWFEFRIGQNLASDHDLATRRSVHGASDLYLGLRFDLTEQESIFPESSLIIQTTVPTGHDEFSAHQMLPGFNLLYGWDIIEDRLTAGASTQVNRRVDDNRHYYGEFAQSFTMGFKWTKRLGQYSEWFALVPTGATASSAATQHYFDGGFTYLVTDNFQLDIRAGVGLNRAATDFFAGSGFAVRY